MVSKNSVRKSEPCTERCVSWLWASSRQEVISLPLGIGSCCKCLRMRLAKAIGVFDASGRCFVAHWRTGRAVASKCRGRWPSAKAWASITWPSNSGSFLKPCTQQSCKSELLISSPGHLSGLWIAIAWPAATRPATKGAVHGKQGWNTLVSVKSPLRDCLTRARRCCS